MTPIASPCSCVLLFRKHLVAESLPLRIAGIELPEVAGLESPLLLIVPMTIAASCAFMMPVATPPNAIVFGSGEVTIPQMCKAGLWLNLVGITLVMLLAYLVVVPVLGIEQL